MYIEDVNNLKTWTQTETNTVILNATVMMNGVFCFP